MTANMRGSEHEMEQQSRCTAQRMSSAFAPSVPSALKSEILNLKFRLPGPSLQRPYPSGTGADFSCLSKLYI
jgi:hypothetical protein